MPYTLIPTSLLIWSVFAGIILAMVFITVQKKAVNTFLNKLHENNCFDEQNAKSLSQLDITSRFTKAIINSSLKGQNGLKRIIKVVMRNGETSSLIGFNGGFDDSDRFYLECDSIQDILKKYEIKKSNPLLTALLVVLLAVIASIATLVLPMLTNYAENTFTGFGKPPATQEPAKASNSSKPTNPNEVENNTYESDLYFPTSPTVSNDLLDQIPQQS